MEGAAALCLSNRTSLTQFVIQCFCAGVLRLRISIRVADEHAALRMTNVREVAYKVKKLHTTYLLNQVLNS